MQARMTGERGNVLPGSQIRFLFPYLDDRVRVASLYYLLHMCINILFPCKKKNSVT